MINKLNYFYVIATLILTLMTLSANPAPPHRESIPEQIQEQKKELEAQKDCMKKLHQKQKTIAEELSKIKELIKEEKGQ